MCCLPWTKLCDVALSRQERPRTVTDSGVQHRTVAKKPRIDELLLAKLIGTGYQFLTFWSQTQPLRAFRLSLVARHSILHHPHDTLAGVGKPRRHGWQRNPSPRPSSDGKRAWCCRCDEILRRHAAGVPLQDDRGSVYRVG
jgi:hypothetical protein